jgi:hypothetical protein
VFVVGTGRWGDPRAKLLDEQEWAAEAPTVLEALQLPAEPGEHLGGLARELDEAYRGVAARFAANEAATVEDGHVHLGKLAAQGDPASLVELRTLVDAMVPRVDLPDLVLEVHAWTGCLDAYTHLSEATARMDDLAVSVAACLLAGACNLGYTPVVNAAYPALTRARLSYVEQNYVRAETHRAANAYLIDYQAGIELAQVLGGGLVASVDGMRFVVPVATVNAGPNPRYFGRGRGITLLNAVNDQALGIGAVVVPGTIRDSLYILDTLLDIDGGPRPEQVVTDTASYSDQVFGLFRLLGFQFSPRLADLPDQRWWRIDPAADYGPLNSVARHRVNMDLIKANWPDLLRLAGSLMTHKVKASQVTRHPGRRQADHLGPGTGRLWPYRQDPAPAELGRRPRLPTGRRDQAQRRGRTPLPGPQDVLRPEGRGPPTLPGGPGGPAVGSRAGGQHGHAVEHQVHRRRRTPAAGRRLHRQGRGPAPPLTARLRPRQLPRPLLLLPAADGTAPASGPKGGRPRRQLNRHWIMVCYPVPQR